MRNGKRAITAAVWWQIWLQTKVAACGCCCCVVSQILAVLQQYCSQPRLHSLLHSAAFEMGAAESAVQAGRSTAAQRPAVATKRSSRLSLPLQALGSIPLRVCAHACHQSRATGPSARDGLDWWVHTAELECPSPHARALPKLATPRGSVVHERVCI